jgi:hypothetical protein
MIKTFTPHIPAPKLLFVVGVMGLGVLAAAWYIKRNARQIIADALPVGSLKYGKAWSDAVDSAGGGASILQDRDGNPVVLPIIL